MNLALLIPVVFTAGAGAVVVCLYMLLRALFGKDLLP